MNNSLTTDHLVIGGGIIGLLTAYYLKQAEQDVTLVEKNSTGKESSWAGGGILSPLYPWQYPQAVTDLVNWGQQQYPDLIKQLFESSGIDSEWTQSGMLFLDGDQNQQATTWAQQQAVDLQIISAAEIHNIDPFISNCFEQGLRLQDIAHVRNPRLVKALKKTLLSMGVHIIENTEVTNINTEQQRVIGATTKKGNTSGTIHCQNIIAACGAWTNTLLSQLGVPVDVEPVQGQMIIIKTEPGMINSVILSEGHYVIPRRDGHVLVGSTLEYVGFEKHTTEDAKLLLFDAAKHILPALEHYPVTHHWAGLRPGSTNNIPTVSKHPNIEGLLINTGHFRNGVIMAPASCKLLTELILGQNPSFNPMFYQLKDHN